MNYRDKFEKAVAKNRNHQIAIGEYLLAEGFENDPEYGTEHDSFLYLIRVENELVRIETRWGRKPMKESSWDAYFISVGHYRLYIVVSDSLVAIFEYGVFEENAHYYSSSLDAIYWIERKLDCALEEIESC